MGITDPANEITYNLVKEYHSKLYHAGISLGARKKALSHIRGFLKSDGVERYDLADKILSLRPRKKSRKEKPPIPKKQLSDIPNAIKIMDEAIRSLWPKHRVVMAILRYYGIRAEEFSYLKVEDLNMDTMTLLVTRGKGNKSRYVAPPAGFEDTIRNLVEPYLQSREDIGPDAPMVLSRRGNPYTWKSLGMIVRRITEKIFGAQFGPHAVRHFYGSWMATLRDENGDILYSVVDIKERLGHASLEVTTGYLHTFAKGRAKKSDQKVLSKNATWIEKIERATSKEEMLGILLSAKFKKEITAKEFEEAKADILKMG